ncbi:VOC family protein [Actinomadura sp. 3N407]|uniref:VOC family protein n=1 Tax=Actinomadura sp. 3N407 TaxID=3457423 RepID=UPI003FCE5EF9
MAKASRYPPGVPCWLGLSSPDVEASKAFYGGLFGWDSYILADDKLGDYVVWTLGGPQGPGVCGLLALADDTERSSWTCQFSVTDMGAAIARVQAAGGLALTDGVDVGHLGNWGLVADPEGASFALWQPYASPGAGVVGEPATMCWVELACRDIDQARRFYGQVFGWTFAGWSCHGTAYTDGKVADRPVAGLVVMDERWPPHYPPHWMPYFAVTDCDASTARAAELGARIRVPPTGAPPGRFALMTDPAGARLAIITPAR